MMTKIMVVDDESRIRKLWFSLRRKHGFDILVTHAPARHLNDMETVPHRGFECFNKLLDKYRPKLFFHGHVHRSYNHKLPQQCVRGDTVVINAFDHVVLDVDI